MLSFYIFIFPHGRLKLVTNSFFLHRGRWNIIIGDDSSSKKKWISVGIDNSKFWNCYATDKPKRTNIHHNPTSLNNLHHKINNIYTFVRQLKFKFFLFAVGKCPGSERVQAQSASRLTANQALTLPSPAPADAPAWTADWHQRSHCTPGTAPSVLTAPRSHLAPPDHIGPSTRPWAFLMMIPSL